MAGKKEVETKDAKKAQALNDAIKQIEKQFGKGSVTLNRASLSSLIRPFYNKKQYISSIYFLLHEFVLVLY